MKIIKRNILTLNNVIKYTCSSDVQNVRKTFKNGIHEKTNGIVFVIDDAIYVLGQDGPNKYLDI